jgi:hypothetical protein
LMHPSPESASVILDTQQHGAGAVDEHATQIRVAALADPE